MRQAKFPVGIVTFRRDFCIERRDQSIAVEKARQQKCIGCTQAVPRPCPGYMTVQETLI
jgi:hypothetical protein